MLADVSVFLALFHSPISLLDAVYVVHSPFGVTLEFSDQESSPDPSRSDGNSCSCFLMLLLKSAQIFSLPSNVSSKNFNYSSLSMVFSIPALYNFLKRQNFCCTSGDDFLEQVWYPLPFVSFYRYNYIILLAAATGGP